MLRATLRDERPRVQVVGDNGGMGATTGKKVDASLVDQGRTTHAVHEHFSVEFLEYVVTPEFGAGIRVDADDVSRSRQRDK